MSASVGGDAFLADLARNLPHGDAAVKLFALAELSGDSGCLRRWGRHIGGPQPSQLRFPPQSRRAIDARLLECVARWGPDPETGPGDVQRIRGILHWALGRPPEGAEADLMLKEMGLSHDLHVDWAAGSRVAAADFRVVVIGAGISGIAMGIRLKRLGIDFEIIEREPELGGTWYVNRYPGCGVDTATHYYSYAFHPNPEWRRYYAKQPEVLDYLKATARTYGITEHIRFRTSVAAARYDESRRRWQLRLLGSDGQVSATRADVVVSAVGLLNKPSVPAFRGLQRYAGRVCHSACWDPDLDLRGQRVALFGAGASANQIGPAIADAVQSLCVVQRTPHWNVGTPEYHQHVPPQEQWLLAHLPVYRRWQRIRTMISQTDVNRAAQLVDPDWRASDGTISLANAQARDQLRRYIVEQLGDRGDLLPQVLPDYPPFSKRMLRDNGWYRMLRRPNVELVTGEVEFRESGFVDGAGRLHEADVCILATGFAASRMLDSCRIIGRDGLDIRRVWGDDDPRAYLGIAVPGFPNFFILYGPNTNIATGGSLCAQAEAQSAYVAKLLRAMLESGIAAVECKRAAFERYNRELDERLAGMVWSVSPEGSWYRNARGRVTTNMPWTTAEYWALTREPRIDDFEQVPLQAGRQRATDRRAR